MVLMALLQTYFSAPPSVISDWLGENRLLPHLSPSELALLPLNRDELSDQQVTDRFWTIEALWALAWVGGIIDDLPFNQKVGNTLASMLPDFQENQPAEPFVRSYRCRPYHELFAQVDLHYRAHWFARNCHHRGIETDVVDLDIIMERRKALEWVLDCSTPWDDITLDT